MQDSTPQAPSPALRQYCFGHSTTPIYYDDYYGYGYAKTRSTDAPAASPITMPDGTKVQPAGENCPIRIFNRFAEQEQ